jgi:signal recognition particle subunit SRP19
MPEHFYVYPAYVEKLPRSSGRRIRAEDGLVDVRVEEIAEAARRLGAKVELEADKHYPRRFFAYAGRVKVTKRAGTSKSQFLRTLAREIKRQRAQGGRA